MKLEDFEYYFEDKVLERGKKLFMDNHLIEGSIYPEHLIEIRNKYF